MAWRPSFTRRWREVEFRPASLLFEDDCADPSDPLNTSLSSAAWDAAAVGINLDERQVEDPALRSGLRNAIEKDRGKVQYRNRSAGACHASRVYYRDYDHPRIIRIGSRCWWTDARRDGIIAWVIGRALRDPILDARHRSLESGIAGINRHTPG